MDKKYNLFLINKWDAEAIRHLKYLTYDRYVIEHTHARKRHENENYYESVRSPF